MLSRFGNWCEALRAGKGGKAAADVSAGLVARVAAAGDARAAAARVMAAREAGRCRLTLSTPH